MELTITLILKFTLGVQIILALFFILLKNNKFTSTDKLNSIVSLKRLGVNFGSFVNLFHKIYHYNIFLFSKYNRKIKMYTNIK